MMDLDPPRREDLTHSVMDDNRKKKVKDFNPQFLKKLSETLITKDLWWGFSCPNQQDDPLEFDSWTL